MTALFRNAATLTAARLGLASPPQWARLEDSTRDVSDEWGDATDPDNERGEDCTAFFDHAQVLCEPELDPHAPAEWQVSAILKGVRITGGTAGNWTTTYHAREDTIARCGEAWVGAVENDQSREENGL